MTAHLHILVGPKELATWREAADFDARTLAGWVRHALNLRAKRVTTDG